MLMNFAPTAPFKSAICPGVTATIKVLNVIERARRDMEIAEHRAEFQRCHREKNALLNAALNRPADDLSAPTVEQIASLPAETQDRLYALAERASLIQSAHIMPAELRASIISLAGCLTATGAAATVDDLIATGPDALITELYAAIQPLAGLTPVQEKNLPSPGSSDSPAATPSESLAVANAA
jgi:hypothetical protein